MKIMKMSSIALYATNEAKATIAMVTVRVTWRLPLMRTSIARPI